MGGMHGFGSVVVPGSEVPYHERWEPRVFAMWAVTEAEGLASGSGRVLREQMPPEEYLRASYYERWQWSNERRLLAKGTIAEGEVDGWVERLRAGEGAPVYADSSQTARVLDIVRTATEELAAAGATRFAADDRVRVRQMNPLGHTRCPRYVRGTEGVITEPRGSYPLPDDGPRRGEIEPVYAVSFRSEDLFGSSNEPGWVVYLDLHESYLEAV
jgi:nitrile hydratase beta subunit